MSNVGRMKGRMMNAKGLFIRIKDYRSRASAAEKNIISFVWDNMGAVTSMNVRDLAEATFTSSSTIIRLCKKLGFKGYREFQRELLYELAASDARDEMVLEDIVKEDGLEQVVRKVMRSDISSLEATARLVSLDVLEVCAARVLSAKTINLFGIGQSQLVCRDFEAKLMRINKQCHAYGDWHNQLLSAKNMSERDLAVAISYSGMTRETVECARAARETGACIIAMTRAQLDSPLARQADYVLNVSASEPLLRSGAMASRMSQLVVIDMLYAACVTEDFERCSAIIKHNIISKDPQV